MITKIFYNNKEVTVSETHKQSDNVVDAIKRLIGFIKSESESLNLEVVNINAFFKEASKYFNFLEAAGGIVINDENKLLIIYRRNKWDLPKGKIDNNEIPLTTAIREVYEECNVKLIENKAEFFEHTYHIYFQEEQYYLKKTWWYLFKINNNQAYNVKPQLSEDIEQIVFCTKEEWINVYSLNTYKTILLLVNNLIQKKKW